MPGRPLAARPFRMARPAPWLALACSLGGLSAPPAAALDPALEISQYGHKAWSAKAGDFRGNVNSIAQTQDGYLWLGTAFGLLRFDGARFVNWSPPAGGELPQIPIFQVLGGRDGSLWVGGDGLGRFRDGIWQRFPELDGFSVQEMLEDRDGTVWVSSLRRPAGRLCAIRGDAAECFGDDGGLGDWPRALHEDAAGRLWLGTVGLWRWRPGPPRHFPERVIRSAISAIAEDAGGRLLLAAGGRLLALAGDQIVAEPLAGADGAEVRAVHLLRDRDRGLWIGTEEGLYHRAPDGRLDRFGRQDGLSADEVRALFEDREGNVWVATVAGLDRFRQLAVPTLTARQGLASNSVSAVLAARDGSLWVAAGTRVQRFKGGAIETFGEREGLSGADVLSLFEDDCGRIWVSTLVASGGLYVYEDGRFHRFRQIITNAFQLKGNRAGQVWMTMREQGLALVTLGGHIFELHPWEKLENKAAMSLADDPETGGVWLGYIRGGLSRMVDGRILEHYDEGDGLGRGQVRDLQWGADGALWAATQGGLSRIDHGRVATLDSSGGLPCDTVHWMRESGAGEARAVWLYSSCGLLRLAPAELAAWSTDPGHRVAVSAWLDQDEGVENTLINGYYTPYVAALPDGRLPYATTDGIALFDPARIPRNLVPPPALVEAVSADGQEYPVVTGQGGQDGRLRLPPRVRDLRIDYTATTLRAPEKVRFRYRLAGVDPDWQEAGNRRQAFYRDLPPGDYHFAVEATNESGVPCERAARLAFAIDPAWYQTWIFRLAALLLLCGLGFAAYRWRLAQVEARLAWQFEQRLVERTRIANELHDTLLQGFISASMQLSLAFARLPADLPEKKRLDQVLALVRRVIDEGRDAVRGLRSEAAESDDLERAFARIPGELGIGQEVTVAMAEGRGRQPHPLVRDEVYRIGREAVVNALRHAGGERISVSLDYRADGLHLEIADDGAGIAPELLEAGREGHFGLAGMRERAARLGGRCAIASKVGQGTRVSLFVPAAVAFRPGAARKGR